MTTIFNDDVDIYQVLKRMAESLKHMHYAGCVHCDVKPLNFVRAAPDDSAGGGAALSYWSWKLIDFDATVAADGGYAGSKSSTGFGPPELLWKSKENGGTIKVKAYREKSNEAGGLEVVREGGGDSESYELLPAHPTFDVWSFGVVAFSVLTASGLFHTNASDNISGSDLLSLYEWSEEQLAQRLREKLPGSHLPESDRRDALQDLVEWCLRRDPQERPQSMVEVLQHAFFEPVDGVRRGEHGIFMSHAQVGSAAAAAAAGRRSC